ncbi:hypothetical protein [Flectobacillus major]|uniref:hypothetical protein n=1 Tax=Flectobacillus major TaxID=103 RepID=UPI00042215B8|nr:hypothetical protein [Flectobacillus major]
MKQSKETRQVFSREYYWSNSYKTKMDIKDVYLDWQRLSDRQADNSYPFKGVVTTDEYKWGESKDATLGEDGKYCYFKPSQSLFNILDLSFHGDFEFKNSKGEIVCIDPSGREEGLSCLLVRKDILFEAMEKENLELVWTIIGEKMITHPINRGPRLSFSGCCFFNEKDNIENRLSFEYW